MYGTKSDGGFGVRGYKVPKQPEKEPISQVGVMKMVQDKNPKSYINMLIAHAKGVPDPRKYSKIIKWCQPEASFAGKWGTEKKITLFHRLGKVSKSLPGPGKYNDHKVKDKMYKIKGTYKR